MTMQNVAWPATMVQNDGSMAPSFMAASSAMPVTMPGNAIGSANRTVSESLPKKRARASANAASVPSSTASIVAHAATRTDNHMAGQMSERANAAPNHLSVSPGGGNWYVRSSVVNA